MKEITLLTGGSSGLGLELAKLYAQGGDVCITARNEKRLAQARQLLGTQHNVLAIPADCASQEDVSRLFSALHHDKYTVTRLIACAGAGLFGEPTETTEQMARTVLDSCLVSLMLPATEALKDMQISGRGELVAVLSTAALVGKPNESVYCAAKWGARGYCEALKAAYKGSAIRIITVSPGGIRTPFWHEKSGQYPDVTKFMEPAELAKTIFDCVQVRASSYCTDLVLEKL